MITYPDNYNPIIEYNEKIQSGEIVACNKIKQIYKHIVENINNPDFEYTYDANQANKAIEFIENYCKHSKGKWAGKPITLELWQKAFLAAVFGMVHKVTRLRQYREVFLVVARKNGKSVIASSVGLKCLVADNEAGAECYSVATKRDQAKIVWSEAVRMIKKSKPLKKRLKCLNSSIIFDKKDGVFAPLSADSSTQDGLNVHCAILDEIHAWKDNNLYDVVVDGMSSREQSLVLSITTAGTERDKIYDLKYEESEMVINGYNDPNGYRDESFLPIIYELDNRSEWTDETAWIKANPNLGVSKNISKLRADVDKAKTMSVMVKNLVCKHFNIRETSSEVWLTFEDLDNRESFDIGELKPKYGFGGTDLSRTTDLTSACLLFEVPSDDIVYVKSMYWIPEELFELRIKENQAYEKWYQNGLLRLCQGNKINPQDVTEWYLELRDKYGVYLYGNGYDRYTAEMWVQQMKGYFGDVMTPVAQGKKTLSNPMRLLGADLKSKKINYENNYMTRWCLSNVAVDVDKNDNIQPCKTSNQRKRIDGFAAMLNAYVVYNDNKVNYHGLIGKK